MPEPPAEAPEEEQDADAIKAAMVEKVGQEIMDAVSNGVDTSSWTEADWEYQIWLYQNEEPADNGKTGEQLQILMSCIMAQILWLILCH